jgi:hypothetical protein
VARLRVLIIGAGRRVQNNFLPSLYCLRDHFEVAGVHARTPEKVIDVSDRWGVTAVLSLDTVDWSRIDVVAVSVPVSQNPVVLQQLAPHAHRLCLVIDTPVATSLQELVACEKNLANFKKVIVTEDYMNFPLFKMTRQALSDGIIGRPGSVTLLNLGYFFHGLALIRSLSNFSPVWRTRVEQVGSFSWNIRYQLLDGFQACVVGPYRPDSNGGILVEGSEGIITEVESDARWGNSHGRPVFTAARVTENGQLHGYRIDNNAGKTVYFAELPQLKEMRTLDFDDKSDLNLCRGCGLMDVFLALFQANNINNHYGAENALYDSFVSRLASRGRLPIDPLLMVNSNVMTLLRAIAIVRHANRGTIS